MTIRQILAALFIGLLSTSCEDIATDDSGSGGLKAIFASPLVNNINTATVAETAQRIRASRFNAVIGLADTHNLRDFVIHPSRSATELDPRVVQNVRTLQRTGVRVGLILRNDWSVRTGRGSISSTGGRPSPASFYDIARIPNETAFAMNVVGAVPGVFLQLNLEPSHSSSVAFYLKLAENIRRAGYDGLLIANFVGEARGLAEEQRSAFKRLNVLFATSQNTFNYNLSEDIINTDGNFEIDAANAAEVINDLDRLGKPYIFWASDVRLPRIPDAFLPR